MVSDASGESVRPTLERFRASVKKKGGLARSNGNKKRKKVKRGCSTEEVEVGIGAVWKTWG